MVQLGVLDFLIIVLLSSFGLYCITDLSIAGYRYLFKKDMGKGIHYGLSRFVGLTTAVFLISWLFLWSGSNFGVYFR